MENRFYFSEWAQDGENTVSAYIVDNETEMVVDTAYVSIDTGEQFTHQGKQFSDYGLSL